MVDPVAGSAARAVNKMQVAVAGTYLKNGAWDHLVLTNARAVRISKVNLGIAEEHLEWLGVGLEVDYEDSYLLLLRPLADGGSQY